MMRRPIGCAASAVLLAAVWPVLAIEPIRVATAGEVDSAVAERARAWAESELAMTVPMAPAVADAAGSLDEVANQAADLIAADGAGLVVLYGGADPAANHGIYRKDLKVVVVNVAAMKAGADDETFARRLERQVIRGIAALLGIEPSPNPDSANAFYETMEELDRMGRNLEPFALMHLQRKALEMGLPVDPNSPLLQ